MNSIILELYESINKEKIRNRTDSIFWVYYTENFFYKEGKVTKRYLKVLLFNRKLDKQAHLLRLSFDFEGVTLDQDEFSIVSKYGNLDVLGFVREIDFASESNKVDILSYICEDGITRPVGKYIENLPLDCKNSKVEAIRKYSTHGNSDILLYPFLNDHFWLCCCGYVNTGISEICDLCRRNKEENQAILSEDTNKLVLDHLQEQIKINLNETVLDTVERYTLAVHEKYAIEFSLINQYVDIQKLQQKQDDMLQAHIRSYIDEHTIQFDDKLSFDENLDAYCQPICSSLINKSMVLNDMNLSDLKQTYTQRKKRIKQKKIKRSFCIVIILITFMLFVLWQRKVQLNQTDTDNLQIEDISREDVIKQLQEILTKSSMLNTVQCNKTVEGTKVDYQEGAYTPYNANVETVMFRKHSADSFYLIENSDTMQWLYKYKKDENMQLRMYHEGVEQFTSDLSPVETYNNLYKYNLLGFEYLSEMITSSDNNQFEFVKQKKGNDAIYTVTMKEDTALSKRIQGQFSEADVVDDIENIHAVEYSVVIIVNEGKEVQKISYKEVYEFPNDTKWDSETTYKFHQQNAVKDEVFSEFNEVWNEKGN